MSFKTSLTRAQADVIAHALRVGNPDSLTEFQIKKFFAWAERVVTEAAVLGLVLDGKLSVGNPRHQVVESCDFDVELME